MWQEQATDNKSIVIKRRARTLWDALLARNGWVAYLPIIAVDILMFCGASWQIFWKNTDAARYQCYALTFWLGSHGTALVPQGQCNFMHLASTAQAPFHILPLEYPPLTIALFSLALLSPLAYYQLVFALLMALTAVLVYWLLLRYGPRGSALVFAIYLLVGAWATAEGRFDLIPAALTLICVIAAERKQWTTAYIMLALGVLIKLYPLLLLPALFIAEQQDAQRIAIPPPSPSLWKLPLELWSTIRGIFKWKWTNTLIFLVVICGVTGLFALLNNYGAFQSQLNYFSNRPVQVESTGSTLLWLARMFGYPVHIVYSYGSINIISALGSKVALLFEALLVVGYLYVIWLQWRGKMDMVQAFIAFLLIFIVTGKVFSPQYLIWIVPLLAYSGAFNRFWLLTWGAISLLTTIIYPYFYTRATNTLLVPYVPGFIQLISIRDALFVFVTLAYLLNWFDARQRKALPPPLTGKETRPLLIEG